jgi:hypothetical protein
MSIMHAHEDMGVARVRETGHEYSVEISDAPSSRLLSRQSMIAQHVKRGLAIVWGVACLGIVAMLLLSQPKVAWNAGARERLFGALNAIACDLRVKDDGVGSSKLDSRDFIPRSMEHRVESTPRNGKVLVEQHGVSMQWRRNGAYEGLLFYPVAVSQEVAIEPQSNAEPTPQIVMVPVDEEDVETLPNLSGCRDVTAERICECQFRRMKLLFSKHGIEYAIMLMSDGSVRALPVDDLRAKRGHH